MNEELNRLLKINALEVDNEINNILPKEFNIDWFNSIFGRSNWEYDYQSCAESITKPIFNLLKRGGKRWRPYLMKLSYNAVGGKEDIKRFLPIPELIHNGTLIIDDIEDNSDLRRSEPCIHKLYGTDIAINVGNSLYYLPLMIIIKDKSLDIKKKEKIYEIINEEMIKISFGQGLDIYWHNNDCCVTENQYLQMCAFKTGTLARLSAKLGAILGDGTNDEINYLGSFAETIGIAFQIQDDILNITNKDWGKVLGDDICEGKKSLMVIHTLEKCDNNDRQRLFDILSMKTKDKELITEAITIMKKYNSIDYAKNKAKNLVKSAWKNINKTIPESESKKKLKLFAEYLINRDI